MHHLSELRERRGRFGTDQVDLDATRNAGDVSTAALADQVDLGLQQRRVLGRQAIVPREDVVALRDEIRGVGLVEILEVLPLLEALPQPQIHSQDLVLGQRIVDAAVFLLFLAVGLREHLSGDRDRLSDVDALRIHGIDAVCAQARPRSEICWVR